MMKSPLMPTLAALLILVLAPKAFHANVGEGGGPADEQQAVQALGAGQEAHRPLRDDVSEAERGKGFGRKGIRRTLKRCLRTTRGPAQRQRLWRADNVRP